MTMADDYSEVYNDDDYLEVGQALQFSRYLLTRLGYEMLPDQELRAIFETFLAEMFREEEKEENDG